MQAVRQVSTEKAAMYNAEAVAARRTATALAVLPKAFDTVRALFGATGPSVMAVQKVRQEFRIQTVNLSSRLVFARSWYSIRLLVFQIYEVLN